MTPSRRAALAGEPGRFPVVRVADVRADLDDGRPDRRGERVWEWDYEPSAISIHELTSDGVVRFVVVFFVGGFQRWEQEEMASLREAVTRANRVRRVAARRWVREGES